MELREIAARLNEPCVRGLLGLAVYPDPVRLDAACARYQSRGALRLLGVERDGGVIGCVGFEPDGADGAIVHHLAVQEHEQRRGIGRSLITGLIAREGFRRLELETDADTIEFYERCGFAVTSLGEKYPGTERFRCVWQAGG
jgi:GNAT superfamily N-acetyltransferase